MNWLWALLRGIGGCLLALLIASLALLGTRVGSEWLLRTLIQNYPALQFEEVDGSFLSGLTLYELRYQQADIDLSAKKLYLQCTWSALTRSQVRCAHLAIKELRVVLPESSSPHTTPTLPAFEFPLSVDLSQVEIHHLRLEQSTKAYLIDQLNFALHAERDTLQLSQLSLTHALGHLQADARLQFLANQYPLAATIRWQADITDVLAAGLNTTGQVQISGSLDHYTAIAKGEFVWQKQQATLDAVVHSKEDGWFIERFLLKDKTQKDHILAQGQIGDALQIKASGHAQRWLEIYPDLHGELDFDLDISGSLQQAALKGNASLRNIAFRNYRIATANLQSELSMQPDAKQMLRLKITGAKFGEHTADAALDLSGTTEQHRAQLTIDAEPSRHLKVTLLGQRSPTQWRATVQNTEFRDLKLGTWQQSANSHLLFDSKKMTLSPLCLQQVESHFCFQGSWQPAAWQASAQLKKWPLAGLQPWLPNSMRLDSGKLDAEFSATKTAEFTPSFTANMQWNASTLLWQEQGKSLYKLPMQSGQWHAIYTKNQLRVNGTIDFGKQQILRADLLASDTRKPWRTIPLQASFTLWLHDLPGLSITLPESTAIPLLQGDFRANLAMKGSLDHPIFSGSAQLKIPLLKLPTQGLQVKDLDIALEAIQQQHVQIQASAQSGSGRIRLQGTLWQKASAWQGQGQLSGQMFEVLATPQQSVRVSPQLTLQFSDSALHVSGQLLIPEARFIVSKLSSDAVSVSSDARILEREGPASPLPWQLYSNVQVQLGKNVRFSGFGLDTRLTGELRIIEEPKKPRIGHGELQLVDGKFKAYGQTLSIPMGRLMFFGALDNPGIDFRAERKVDDQVVGVTARGSLRTPELKLFANPPLDDKDTLAYLVMSRPLSLATQQEGSMLTNAAVRLGVEGGNLLAQRIGQQLGLKNFSFSTQQRGQATMFNVGTYLAPSVYLSYGRPILSSLISQPIWMLQYQWSKAVTLEASQGEGAAMDVHYKVEFD